MHEAVGIVNGNNARIAGTLRASGPVDGRFVLSDGRSGGFHVDGTLFFLAPRYVRFDLKRFGDRKFLIGSNDEYYWYYDGEEDAYECGRHGYEEDLLSDLPLTPDQIVDALALTPIPTESSGSTRLVQRVVSDYQQVLVLVYDDQGRLALEKEYWLDRFEPQLVRRVVFRDGDGAVTLESALDDYRSQTSEGPLLPHLMAAEWPESEARLRFHVRRWEQFEDIGPESIQFARPRECE
jgi:hypothetical protein